MACFFVPDFPLSAHIRAQPSFERAAFAVLDGRGSSARVVHAAEPARASGVRPGLTAAQARSIHPRVVLRARDAAAERSTRAALAELADAFSPRVEVSGDDAAFLDMTGVRDEKRLSLDAMARARSLGLPLRVGCASNKLCARFAAEEARDVPVVVGAGEEREFLSGFSIGRLKPSEEAFARLSRWDVRTIGDFARLPPKQLLERLGPEALSLHKAAHGRDDRPLLPHRPPPVFIEGVELEWSFAEAEPFLHVCKELLERLTARLASADAACRRLDVSLTLDPQGHESRSLPLAAPTRDMKILLQLVQLDIEQEPPQGPVNGVCLRAHPEKQKNVQMSLFGPPSLSPDRLSQAVARLSALVGPDRLGSPVAPDGRVPGRCSLAVFAPPPSPEFDEPVFAQKTRAAVRVVRPPSSIDASVRSGRPVAIHARGPHRAGGEIRVASGPWRMEERWWSGEPVSRDYWDVELVAGDVCRIFQTAEGAWFLDGFYD